ncbi:MAG: hypothetical protein ACK551_05695 [Vampirovibrionales bacterium]
MMKLYRGDNDPRIGLRTRYDLRRDCFITSHTRFNFFTTTGGSRTESEKHFMDKLEAWFAVMEEAGKPIDPSATYEKPPGIVGRPKSDRVRMHIWVSPNFKKFLQREAKALHVSFSDVIEQAFMHYFTKEAHKELWELRGEEGPH